MFREDPERAYQISDFEAKILDKVTRTFIAALDQFEDNLHRGRWGRCLYLDAYLPRFLKGFYYLYCASRNSVDAMPVSARVADSLYEVSLSSLSSDARINQWRQNDNAIKLRIVTKELIFQLESWQKKEVGNPKRDPEMTTGRELENAFALFVRSYFNTRPASTAAKIR